MKKPYDYYSFNIDTHFMPAMINDDYSGLDDDDIKALKHFFNNNTFKRFGHWDYTNEVSFGRDDVTGLMGDVATVRYVVFQSIEELTEELENDHSTAFFIEGDEWVRIFWSDANNGYMVKLYRDGYHVDGGLCTGTARDAVEFML